VIAGCAGALIAGGKGTRLGGAKKYLIVLDGETLLARTERLFRGLFAEVFAVSPEPLPALTTIPDAIPGKGAPGGVHTALQHARAEWVFSAACDMPYLDAAAIERLAGARGDADAALYRVAGRVEPLCAFWRKTALPLFDARLRAGDPSFRDLLGELRVNFVDTADAKPFENLNTPDDLARAKAKL
jgi:molybdopterin-guanine dinucleotide biosynthesis protein A